MQLERDDLLRTSWCGLLPVRPYGYKIGAPVTSAATCASMVYKVTLTGTGNVSLAERTGTLDSNGEALANFTSENIAASDVLGASIVITG